MNNFYSKLITGVTDWSLPALDIPCAGLDKAITYGKNVIVSCEGVLTFNATTGALSWSAPLVIHFNRTDGQGVKNSVATGSVTLTAGQFAYCDLSETNNAVITVAAATVTTGAASNFIAVARLVLAHRNSASGNLYPVALPQRFVKAPALVQTITPADSVTIDWTLGETALLTLNRATTAITMTNAESGGVYRIVLLQSGGSRLVTFVDAIRWANGATPVLTTADAQEDIATLLRVGTSWRGSVTANF